ncbi:MAG: toll/interleukin-1 receptor domain-containing protein [Deltaproteobacteria bacterium]|nr:toll/interleukin-1 receptor domain-containing protein [Deltaproteobacteria bacterium]
MADIFISYRRADEGFGNWIASVLKRQFAIFYDKGTIEPGDHFPSEISEALAAFKIFLAVIGPGWLTEIQLKRLFDPKDWVRREIMAGLERTGVRIVPVLVGGVELPSKSVLPEALQLLVEHQAIDMRYEQHDSDLSPLVNSLNGWLGGSAYSASVREPMPQAVAYLCDRTAQEDNLIDVFTEEHGHGKTPVIILHGHKWEEHYGFIQRLRSQRILEDVLGVRDDDIGIDVQPLRWNMETLKGASYQKALFTAIKRDLLQKRMLSDQEVRNYFRNIRRPLVLTLEFTGSDIKRGGENLFKGFLSAWQGLFQEKNENAETRVIEPPFVVLLWLNISYDDPAQSLPFEKILTTSAQPRFSVLPILNPLRDRHLRTWLAMDAVNPYVTGRERRVLSLIEDENVCHEKGKMHMGCFVDAVQEILM